MSIIVLPKRRPSIRAVFTPIPNWNSPLLEHCISIAVIFGDRPVRFDKYQTTPTFLDVISTGNLNREYLSRTGQLTYRARNITNDRISLGTITSDDPWSFFGQTEVSVIASHQGTGLIRNFGRFVDTTITGGWAWYNWNTIPNRMIFNINSNFQMYGDINDIFTDKIRVVGCSITGIPLSGTATGTVDVYDNGQRTGGRSASIPAFPSTASRSASIFNEPTGTATARPKEGWINYVAIFDKALTAEEHRAWAQDEFGWVDSTEFIPLSLVAPEVAYKITMII